MTSRTITALLAALALLLSLSTFALATDHETDGVGEADCPEGTSFVVNFEMGDIVEGLILVDGEGDADLVVTGLVLKEGTDEVIGVTVSNDTEDDYFIAVKGGSDQTGNAVLVVAGAVDVEVVVAAEAGGSGTSAGLSNLSVCLVVVPAESLPAESFPAESLPAESFPAESLPAESLPAESLPAESVPAESVPASQPLTGGGTPGLPNTASNDGGVNPLALGLALMGAGALTLLGAAAARRRAR